MADILKDPSLDDLLQMIGELAVRVDAVRAATQARVDGYLKNNASTPALEAEIARQWAEYLYTLSRGKNRVPDDTKPALWRKAT